MARRGREIRKRLVPWREKNELGKSRLGGREGYGVKVFEKVS